jgi:hypothetical protein
VLEDEIGLVEWSLENMQKIIEEDRESVVKC